ncbi:MAG: hypothetical protein N2746_00510 [Deltaproteobacteria bacterium]|nr:hypothetical protein [Deltaproteobacteria bacterium]
MILFWSNICPSHRYLKKGILVLMVVVSNLFLFCQMPETVSIVRDNCPVGSLRVGNYCVVSVGTRCDGSSDCVGGFCMQNYNEKYCTQLCSYDYDCPLGYFCSLVGNNKLCVKSIYSKTICSINSECEPCGLCVNGVCELSNFCIVTLCGDDSDCGSCRVCQDGKCFPIEKCGRGCISNMDCDEDQICDRDYQGRLACLPKIPRETGMFCEGKEPYKECRSGICLFADGYVYSYCSRSCSNNSDCPYDFYCDFFPTYPDKRVCIKNGIYAPRKCNSSSDCEYNLKCRYSFSIDKDKITTFCGILNSGMVSQHYCDRYYECRWGMCGRPEYCKDSCRSFCTMPCYEDADCPESFVCEGMLSNEGDVYYKGCVNYKDVKNEIGEFCMYSDDVCRNSLCVKNSDIFYCSRYCANDSDCPKGFLCRLIDDRMVCQKEVSPSDCYSDADCQDGFFCSLIQEGSIRNVKCHRPEGDFAVVGESCDKGCASGICLPETNTCSAFCKTRYDCPHDYVCVFADIDVGFGQEMTVKLCVPNPGSLFPCSRDEGCPEGEVCRVSIDKRSGEIESICMRIYSRLKDYNEICYANDECVSGICLPDSETDISLGFYGRCTKFCATDDDCSMDDVCKIVPVYFDYEYAKAARVCAPRFMKTTVGVDCMDNPYVCEDGFCAHVDKKRAYCTERCRNHFDCSKSLTVCRLIDKIGTICLPVNYYQEE